MSASRRLPFLIILCGTLFGSAVAPAQVAGALKPGPLVDYAPLAFQPKTWIEKGQSTMLLPWTGTEVVFLTTPGEYDGALMGQWVGRLDAGWRLYAELTGARPSLLKHLGGKVTIAAVPDFDYTCGAGCGFLGATGIELAMFYRWNYPALEKDPKNFPHYVFYEMGRNYFTFGDRHSCFGTGFAVFMRYVCMDKVDCHDDDRKTRETIERAEMLVAKSGLTFLRCFTFADGLDEKAPRLKDEAGRWVEPSDQPVTYASAMLKLRREHGGDEWTRRFFRALGEAPDGDPKTLEGARTQCWNWFLAASVAAREDLSPTFCDQWKLPLAPATRSALRSVNWRPPGLGLRELNARIQPEWQDSGGQPQ